MPSVNEVSSPAAPDGTLPTRVRTDIEGLRAVAVGLVILDHLVHWPSGGFIGVDVFFVISGFLITTLLLKEVRADGRLSFGDFYRRRARRILPNSILVIAATLLASAILAPTSRLGSILTDGLWTLLFAGNWRMASSGTDYFQVGLPPSPLQHYWSLGVEEQFYVVWPVLILVAVTGARLLPRRVGRTGALVLACGAVVLLSLVWSWFETTGSPTVAYFSSISRAWELAIGAMLAILAPWCTAIPRSIRSPLALLGLAGIVASAWWISSDSAFPTPVAVWPVLATTLVIAAGTGTTQTPSRWLWPLTNTVMQYGGKLSFSLYLWHFPVAVLLVYVLDDGTLAYVATALALTVGLSVASFYLVEQPVRRSSWLEPRNRETSRSRARTPLTLIAVFAVASTAFTVWQSERDQTVDVRTISAEVGASCFGAAALLSPEDCVATSDVTPSVDAAQGDDDESYACWADEDEALEPCTYGSTDPDARRVAFVGDSHAGALLPAMRDIAESEGWSLSVYTGFGCQWRVNVNVDECGEGIDAAERDFLEGPEFDLVVTTAARWVVTAPDDTGEEYAPRWREVTGRGTPVVAIGDNPAVAESTLSCLQRLGFDPAEDRCSTSRDEAFADVDPLREAAEITPGAALVDLDDVYCTDEDCPAIIGSVVVYRDTADHITDTFSHTITPILRDRLLDALGEARAELD